MQTHNNNNIMEEEFTSDNYIRPLPPSLNIRPLIIPQNINTSNTINTSDNTNSDSHDSPIDDYNTNISYTISDASIGQKVSSAWRFATVNACGLRQNNKQDDILTLYNLFNIDFLAITETKLLQQSAKFTFFQSNNYHHIWTCNNERAFGSGLSLLINK